MNTLQFEVFKLLFIEVLKINFFSTWEIIDNKKKFEIYTDFELTDSQKEVVYEIDYVINHCLGTILTDVDIDVDVDESNNGDHIIIAQEILSVYRYIQ